jgi:hypothetical protein
MAENNHKGKQWVYEVDTVMATMDCDAWETNGKAIFQ